MLKIETMFCSLNFFFVYLHHEQKKKIIVDKIVEHNKKYL